MGYASYPMKTLRMSSLYNTGAPHIACSKGTPCDYPTDLVGVDGGRDWMYNRFGSAIVVLRAYTKASHAIWCRTTEKVAVPGSKKLVYLYFMCEHQTNDEMPSVGTVIPVGAKLWREAACGNATGNHLHISFGISETVRNVGNGWIKNSRGAWVMHIDGVENIKIQDALFLDPTFTTNVKDNRVPFYEAQFFEVGKKYKVISLVNVRTDHSITAPKVGYSRLTANAKKHANPDGKLTVGTVVTALDVWADNNEIWLRIPSGWICAFRKGKEYVE